MTSPGTPDPITNAGRSADARGDTGTDADVRPGTSTGGIPATVDSGIADKLSPSAGPTGMSIDRDRPTPSAGDKTPAAAGTGSSPTAAESQDEGPVESQRSSPSVPSSGAVEAEARRFFGQS